MMFFRNFVAELKYIIGMRKLSVLDMNRMSVEEFKVSDKLPLVVVLDEVRSLYNVGSVFRYGRCFPCGAYLLVWHNSYAAECGDSQDGTGS